MIRLHFAQEEELLASIAVHGAETLDPC